MSAPPVPRRLSVDDSDFEEILGASLADGAALWIRASGSSMSPTIPDGALVRLRALSRTPRIGDIVLARSATRGFVLHRVTSLQGTHIATSGDNRIDRDPAVPVSAVAAIADGVQLSGVMRELRGGRAVTFWFQLRRLGRRVVRRLSLLSVGSLRA